METPLLDALGGKTVDDAKLRAEIARLEGEAPEPVPVIPPTITPAPTPPYVPTPPPAPSGTWISLPDATTITVNGAKLGTQTPDKPYSLQISDTGEERYEIRAGEHCANDGSKTDKRRSELSGLTFPAQGLVAFAYDLLVEPQSFADDVQYVFGQAHKGKRDPGDDAGEHPFSAFRIVKGGRPGFTVCGSNAKPLTTAEIARAKSINVWTGDASQFRLGEWHSVRQVLMQGGDHSWAELWLDGVRVARYEGPIGYPNAAPPYWKRGVYNAQKSAETCVPRYRQRPAAGRLMRCFLIATPISLLLWAGLIALVRPRLALTRTAPGGPALICKPTRSSPGGLLCV